MITQRRTDAKAIAFIKAEFHANPQVIAKDVITALKAAIEARTTDVETKDVPSQQTVWRILKDLRERRDQQAGEVWRVRPGNGGDARLILPVIWAAFEATGRFDLTNSEAEWIVTIRQAVPDLSPYGVLQVARYYIDSPDGSRAVDFLLAATPWRGKAYLERLTGRPDLYELGRRLSVIQLLGDFAPEAEFMADFMDDAISRAVALEKTDKPEKQTRRTKGNDE